MIAGHLQCSTNRLRAPLGAIAAGLLAGCAQGLTTGALPAVPQLPTLPSQLLPPAEKVVGRPIEVYTNVARGALACWFGAAGPLKGTHIYHAEAEPESRGGHAEIVLHEKDSAAPSPRALRAFLVSITREGETTMVATENLKFPEAVGTAMKADVKRWAAGETGCSSDLASAAGWRPAPAPAPMAKTAVKAKRTAKPSTR